MERKIFTEDEFLKANIRQISQVYYGKRECCRCGCGGEYTATSFMQNPRSDVNNETVEQRLARAKRLVRAGMVVSYGPTWVDVMSGRNRSLTFYFDEVDSSKE